MSYSTLDLSKLQAKLLENVADYSRIFVLHQANGFTIKQDPLFTGFQVRDAVPLVRSSSDPMVQPGRTGQTNFKGGVGLANREGRLRPFKVDLQLTEKQIYAWSKSYLAKKTPMDPSDIYSFPAMNWYMQQIFNQIGKDVNGTIYNGVYNPTGQTNLDITDGLAMLFLQGYAAAGSSANAIGDIPSANMVTSAATITQSNILSEIQNLAMCFFQQMDTPLEEEGCMAIDPLLWALMINALNAQLSNSSQIVYRDGAKIRLAVLPNICIEPRWWLKGTSKMFITLNGNLAVLGPEENTEDIPSIDIEKVSRNINIFIDGEIGINYCDGRVLFMNSK